MSSSELRPSDLVLAMPRRELYGVCGFTTRVDMRVIACLADEYWYASPDLIAEDVDAKEVHLGLVMVRGSEMLVAEDGVLLHTTLIPAEAAELGLGLSALKAFATLAAEAMLAHSVQSIEMMGYLNDDSLPELRRYFVLVYRVVVAPNCPAPQGFAWVATRMLHSLPLTPVSLLVLADLTGSGRDEQS